MDIYTRTGDDGTTGLLYGGRVAKDSLAPAAYGDVDEAQAAIGMARATVGRSGELDGLLTAIERDLWVLMAELATAPQNRSKLTAGSTLVTEEMVGRLESSIDEYQTRYEAPREFVVPGQDPTSAALDFARTVTRRAERSTVALGLEGSVAAKYLNRLSDLLFVYARWAEGQWMAVRDVPE
ncbi:MAG: cob(I)yrinic acid a,c-diamide adenosyltransferase [Microthrixaceae bacterium]